MLQKEALVISPEFVFSHDSGITWEDLRTILAQSYFLQGAYEQATDQVELLGGVRPIPTSPNFEVDLFLQMIELATERSGQ